MSNLRRVGGLGSAAMVGLALLAVAGESRAQGNSEEAHANAPGQIKKQQSVPEIPVGGAAAALTLVAGGAAIVLGRRRRRA
jgi:hypothetical protein